MPRPPSDVRRRLLTAGRLLIEDKGLGALTVRGLARRAAVNLGLFHYHFRSRERFVRELLQETYEKFFSQLSMESGGAGLALDRLERSMIIFGRFGRENRRLLSMLLREALNGDKTTIAFAKRNIPRHAGIILGLLRECAERGQLPPLPLPALMSFLLGGMGVPNLVVSLLEKSKARRPFGMSPASARESLVSDSVITARARLLIGALKSSAGSGRRS